MFITGTGSCPSPFETDAMDCYVFSPMIATMDVSATVAPDRLATAYANDRAVGAC